MNLAANRLIPLAAFSVLAMAVWVGIRSFSAGDSAALSEVPAAPAPDADTPAETIRTLTAEVAALKNQTTELIRQNDALTRENRNLRTDISGAVQAEVAAELSQRGVGGTDQTVLALEDRVQELTARLEQALAGLQSPAPAPPESGPVVELPAEPTGIEPTGLPVGQGLRGFELESLAALGVDSQPRGVDGAGPALVWVQPLERPDLAAAQEAAGGPGGESGFGGLTSGLALPSLAARAGEGAGPAAQADDQAVNSPSPWDALAAAGGGGNLLSPAIPFYTLPRNATLIGSTAMTALVGRIPVGGTVQDPMPFKVIVGRDNLAANGLTVPGVNGIVAAGVATGDWTLACVRGEITSLTFVFEDGSIVTHSADAGGDGSSGGLGGPGGGGSGALGWISDDQGIPCVSGERITNAPSFLASRIGLIAAQGAAEAYAQSQTTTRTSVFGTESRSVTGDVGAYVAGRTASEGAGEVGRWLQERQAQSFDAVFVRPGVRVAIHLDREIPIDLDPNGRRISYDTALDSRYVPILD